MVYYHIRKILPLVSNLGQLNSVHTFPYTSLRSILILYPPIYTLVFRVVSSLQVFQPKSIKNGIAVCEIGSWTNR